MIQSFKKSRYYKKLGILTFFSFLFSPISLYSEEKKIPVSISITKVGPLFPHFWENLKQTIAIPIPNEEVLKLQIHKNHLQILVYLYNKENPILFKEHFFKKFDQSFENQKETSDKVIHLMSTLKSESSKEIQTFIKDHNFTKADKMLALLFLTFNNRSDIDIFHLIESINLSPNDSLSFKDIDSQFIPENLKNSEGVIIVLSHLLVNMGKLKVIEKLLSSKYDPDIKNQQEENILHSTIRFNKLFTLNEYKEILYSLANHSKKLINEKNQMGYTPLSLAVIQRDKVAVEILMDKKLSADLHTINHLNENLREMAKKTKDLEMIDYLNNNLPKKINKPSPLVKKETKQKYLHLSQLDFSRLIHKIGSQVFNDPNKFFFDETKAQTPATKAQTPATETQTPTTEAQTQSNEKYLYVHQDEELPYTAQEFYDFFAKQSMKLNLFEHVRTGIINNLFYSEEKDTPYTLTLKAILLKDAQFFNNSYSNKNLIEEPLFLISNKIKISHNQVSDLTIATDLLLEAIRHSFLPAVKSLINVYKNYQQGKYSLSLDPLSLSILTYASLKETDPLKKDAKEIIKLIANNINSEEGYFSSLEIKPIYLAIILGLLEEVKFLHEIKGEEIKANINVFNFNFDILKYTEGQDFIALSNYLKLVQMKSIGISPSKCMGTFLN